MKSDRITTEQKTLFCNQVEKLDVLPSKLKKENNLVHNIEMTLSFFQSMELVWSFFDRSLENYTSLSKDQFPYERFILNALTAFYMAFSDVANAANIANFMGTENLGKAFIDEYQETLSFYECMILLGIKNKPAIIENNPSYLDIYYSAVKTENIFSANEISHSSFAIGFNLMCRLSRFDRFDDFIRTIRKTESDKLIYLTDLEASLCMRSNMNLYEKADIRIFLFTDPKNKASQREFFSQFSIKPNQIPFQQLLKEKERAYDEEKRRKAEKSFEPVMQNKFKNTNSKKKGNKHKNKNNNPKSARNEKKNKNESRNNHENNNNNSVEQIEALSAPKAVIKTEINEVQVLRKKTTKPEKEKREEKRTKKLIMDEIHRRADHIQKVLDIQVKFAPEYVPSVDELSFYKRLQNTSDASTIKWSDFLKAMLTYGWHKTNGNGSLRTFYAPFWMSQVQTSGVDALKIHASSFLVHRPHGDSDNLHMGCIPFIQNGLSRNMGLSLPMIEAMIKNHNSNE